MKLASLRLHGFKSFPERTDIVFHEGITAIVGPNGCGKSNISDAVRWVLGEQRPTVVRGSRMEEVIFQGTVNRRPINRGSVVLRVTNEDGVLPVPFGEVEIGRTVYRDGGSEYSINRATCRLRDVQELCRDTGLGANAYAIIESRMIDAILSERAEERRGLFEEAAGIGKYKDRSRIAGRRLARAELDLERLEDVIAEVATKVRSLARQKGKAQRYDDLRKRRLSVEVAVVSMDLVEVEDRLTRVRELLAREEEARQTTLIELRTAETEREASRVRRLEAEKSRADAAVVLDSIQKDLVRWERDLAVARERIVYADRRLGQIGEDRDTVRTRAGELASELAELQRSRARIAAELAEVGVESRQARQVAARTRERLRRARATLAEVRGKERSLLRRVASMEGTVAASRTRLAELRRRLVRLEERASQTELELTGMRREGGESDDRVVRLEASAARVREGVNEGLRDFAEARAAQARARAGEVEAVDEASALEARRTALETMEREGAGYEPVVRAAREAHPNLVLGTLSQCMAGPAGALAAAESYLGHLAQALLVEDGAAAARLRRWFAEEWTEGGGIVLLRLDEVGEPGQPGSLLGELRPEGPGAPWVRVLLAGVDSAEALDSPGVTGAPGHDHAVASVDARGVLVVGNPAGTAGLLERRGKLAALEEAAAAAAREASRARETRAAAQARVERAEKVLEERRAALTRAEDDLRAARADRSTHGERHTRLTRDSDDLARRVRNTREAIAAATGRQGAEQEELQELTAEAASLRRRGERAAEVLEVAEGDWERARVEEARLAIQSNQHKGELARADERLGDLGRAEAQASAQLARLEKEEAQLGRELSEARALLARGGKAVERLFRRRDRAKERLTEDDVALERAKEEVKQVDRRVEAARAAERAASDRHHDLNLEERELGGRIVLIRERVETEWARPFEKLVEMAEPAEGDPAELKEELAGLVQSIERLGPVNMLAIEEHAEQNERLTFLAGQRDDLERARNDLRAAIREIDQTATRIFLETFEAARENFRKIHQRLFEGGECDLRLGDPEDPLSGPVDIHASPMGKRTRRIDLLSGGERALTALALLFGIYLVKPSPFCVLDEVDAPLDESNIDRFVQLLREFKQQSQFVVITHNPRTIEAADWIYGLTMEEPGVSSMVGVRLEAGASA